MTMDRKMLGLAVREFAMTILNFLISAMAQYGKPPEFGAINP